MSVTDPYQLFGQGYRNHRQPDAHIAGLIATALGTPRTVVNVGAGTGAYEPANRSVTAVEPSGVMIGQRPAGSAPVVRAWAEHLPFPDRTFDAGMAVLTVHHWTDPAAGLAELRRVSRKQVVLTWDQQVMARFWLIADYLPEIAEAETGQARPAPGGTSHGRTCRRPGTGPLASTPCGPVRHSISGPRLPAADRRLTPAAAGASLARADR